MVDSKSDIHESEEPSEATITPPHRPEPLRRGVVSEEAAFSYGEAQLPYGETPNTPEAGKIQLGESETAANRDTRGGESGTQASAFILGEQE